MSGRMIGYARVSTDDQENEAQRRALKAAGCTIIYQDKASGAARDRPELSMCLESMRKGDTLVVARLDRLARSLSHLLQIIEDLEGKGAFFRSLADPFDTSSPQGILMMQMLGAFAQFERSLIRERTKAGLAVAKSRGKKLGNPRLREKDPVAIRIMKASLADTYLQRARSSSLQWRSTVERFRPRLSWDVIARHINADRKNDVITTQQLRRHVKRLVAAGEMSADVLTPARAPGRPEISAVARELKRENPGLTLRALGELLEAEGHHPPRAQKWSAETVKKLLASPVLAQFEDRR